MAKLKMTQQEKEAAVKAAAENVGEDVGATVSKSVSSDERPKKKAKAKRKHRTTDSDRQTPAQESAAPDRKARSGDPLKGATVDPTANYPKILHMVISVGDDDTRSMEDFVSEVRAALKDEASAKNATVLLEQYQIDGQHILSHHYDAAVAEQTEQTEGTDA